MRDRQIFKLQSDRGKRLRVLHIVPSFYPATVWGGPVFSTKAICDEIAAKDDFHLRVLTTDSAGPKRTQNLHLDTRTQLLSNGYEVHYARRELRNSISFGMLRLLPAQIRWADVVHLTGTYSSPTLPTLLLAKLYGKPLVWSPRGALQATAEWQAAPSRLRKTAFEYLIRFFRPRDIVLHATAQVERDLSLKRIPRMVTEIISNSVPIPPALHLLKEWRKGGKVRLMFLSRVHQKKGIEGLIDALYLLPEHFELDIFGQGDATYVESLKNRVRGLGLAGRVRFRGHADSADKTVAFMEADIFVLPTHSENFGIVVAEAMAHGVPVIVTKGAPWSEIDERGAGFWIDNSPEQLVTAIKTLSKADLEQVGLCGRAWMEEEFSPTAMGVSFAQLYRRLARNQYDNTSD